MNNYSYPYHMAYYQPQCIRQFPQYQESKEITDQLIQPPLYPYLKSQISNSIDPMMESIMGNQRQPFNPQGIWEINANASVGQLNLNIDSSGNVTGSMFNNPIRGGFFDFESQKIIFQRVPNSAIDNQDQIYEGYLFRPECPGDCPEFIAGTFIAFQGAGGTAKRNKFGWFAKRIHVG